MKQAKIPIYRTTFFSSRKGRMILLGRDCRCGIIEVTLAFVYLQYLVGDYLVAKVTTKRCIDTGDLISV